MPVGEGAIRVTTSRVEDVDMEAGGSGAVAPGRRVLAWGSAGRPAGAERQLKPGRLDGLTSSRRTISSALAQNALPGKRMFAAEDFARGGSAEAFRQSDGSWKALWAQDLQ